MAGVNKSGTADTALKTRLPTIYSGAPPLRSPAPPRGAGEPNRILGWSPAPPWGAGLPTEGSRPKFLAEPPFAPRTMDFAPIIALTLLGAVIFAIMSQPYETKLPAMRSNASEKGCRCTHPRRAAQSPRA